ISFPTRRSSDLLRPILKQGEAEFRELAAQGDEGGRAAQTAVSQPQVVRGPQLVVPGLHGGVEQQTPDLAVTLLGELASPLPAAGLSNPHVEAFVGSSASRDRQDQGRRGGRDLYARSRALLTIQVRTSGP